MCRFFAVRSTTPVSLAAALWNDPTALVAQSRCDRRGECHGSGWGIATYNSVPHVVRSIEAAYSDPAYQENARRLNATLALAHVRQASVGEPALENTHPFVYGRWVFAHNGTLQRFGERKQLLLDATPTDLRRQIGGTTDSEHIFYYWLGQLRLTVNELNGPVSGHAVVESLVSTIRQLVEWFPACDGEETKLNFLLTNGSLLAATRWQHSLHLLERSYEDVEGKPNRSILIASEPTSEGDWREVADRSLVIVDDKLRLQTAKT